MDSVAATLCDSSETLAREIAASYHDGSVRNRVVFDKDADTWAVEVRIGFRIFTLLMPAEGAFYALYGNGNWFGGMNMRRGEATPKDVAERLLHRIAEVTGW